ncbi:MAG: LamG domain-containing protein [Candidatus Competibacteraceae bacterium]|nr:LamG domain-containing protein [Candidatus Competibacteraceae bacterium]
MGQSNAEHPTDIHFVNGELYVVGRFILGGSQQTLNRVAHWNGTAFEAIGEGTNAAIYTVESYEFESAVGIGDLAVGGAFTEADGVTANKAAVWNGGEWDVLGTGFNNTVWAMETVSNRLYAGGQFTTASGVSANRVAYWGGSIWDNLGSGLNGNCYAISAFGGDPDPYGGEINPFVAVGGLFTTAGGVSASNVALWNPTTQVWTAFGTGNDGEVRALIEYETDLIAGGAFLNAGGVSANRIARWNGTAWTALGAGMNGVVRALTAFNGNIVAGGTFTQAGGNTANRIAQWNGTAWSTFGSGFNGDVYALVEFDGDLVAGGTFSTAGGNAASSVAVWNGVVWSQIGDGLPEDIYSLVVYRGKLIAVGQGSLGEGVSYEWDRVNWSPMKNVSTAMPTRFHLGWNYRQELVVQSSQVQGTHSGIPILLTQANFPTVMLDADGGKSALSGGGDVRVSTDADGNNLVPIDIVRFETNNNPSLARTEVWAKLPVQSSANTTFYVWWGKAGETQPATTNPAGRNAVYSDYQLVTHLDANPSGTAPQVTDVTGNSRDGTTSGMVAGNRIDYGIGRGYDFDGSNDYVSFGGGQWFDPQGNWTISFIASVDDLTNNSAALFGWSDGFIYNTYLMFVHRQDQGGVVLQYDQYGGYAEFTPSHAITAGVKYHWSVVRDAANGRYKLYKDGALVVDAAWSPFFFAYSQQFAIGSWSPTGGSHVDGQIDEFRVIVGALSLQRIATEYNNHSSPQTFTLANGTVLENTENAAVFDDGVYAAAVFTNLCGTCPAQSKLGIYFEDLPASLADWDYFDRVVEICFPDCDSLTINKIGEDNFGNGVYEFTNSSLSPFVFAVYSSYGDASYNHRFVFVQCDTDGLNEITLWDSGYLDKATLCNDALILPAGKRLRVKMLVQDTGETYYHDAIDNGHVRALVETDCLTVEIPPTPTPTPTATPIPTPTPTPEPTSTPEPTPTLTPVVYEPGGWQIWFEQFNAPAIRRPDGGYIVWFENYTVSPPVYGGWEIFFERFVPEAEIPLYTGGWEVDWILLSDPTIYEGGWEVDWVLRADPAVYDGGWDVDWETTQVSFTNG